MPGRIPDPRLKDPAVYEALLDERASQAKAAAGTSVAASGGRAGDHEHWSVDDLRDRAAELGIAGGSAMCREELIEALRGR